MSPCVASMKCKLTDRSVISVRADSCRNNAHYYHIYDIVFDAGSLEYEICVFLMGYQCLDETCFSRQCMMQVMGLESLCLQLVLLVVQRDARVSATSTLTCVSRFARVVHQRCPTDVVLRACAGCFGQGVWFAPAARLYFCCC